MITCLIVGRIWHVSRGSTLYGLARQSYTCKAIYVIVESGALYFIVQIILMVVYGLGHPSQNIMVVIAIQVYVSIILYLLSSV